jgi:hypothetical protein
MGRGVIPGNTKGLCVSSHNSRERKDRRYVAEKDALRHLLWYFTEQSSVNQNALVGPQPNPAWQYRAKRKAEASLSRHLAT